MQCDIKLWRSVALGGQMLVVVDVQSVCIHSLFFVQLRVFRELCSLF